VLAYRTSSGLEHGHAASGRLPLGLGDDGLEDLGGDVPELLVLGAEEDDGAVALRVEARGDVLDGLLDDLLDASGGDGQLLAERVVGAAVLDEVKDRVGVGGRHLDGGGGERAEGSGRCGGSSECGSCSRENP